MIATLLAGWLAADVAVRPYDGPPVSGAFVALTPAGELQLEGRPALAPGTWYGLSDGKPLPAFPADRPHLLTARGDWLPGEVATVQGERVKFAWAGGAEWTLPLSLVRRIAWQGSERLLEPDFVPATPGRDQLLLRNGDRRAGSLVAVGADAATWQADKVDEAIPVDRLAAWVADPRLARPGKLPALAYWLTLADGTRLHCAALEATADAFRARPVWGGELRGRTSDIRAIVRLDGRLTWASDQPAKYQPQPLFSELPATLGVDRNALGRPLRIGASTFSKGFGVQAPCVLTLEPPAKAMRLELVAGLDAVDGRWGQVTVRCDLAPTVAHNLTSDTPPLNLSYPLTSSRPVVFRLETTAGGGVQGRVNLGAVRWMKTL